MLYAAIELKTRCPKCDNPVMLNGPARKVVCPTCQNDIKIHPMEWKSVLEDIPGELKDVRMGEGTQSQTLMASFQRELKAVRQNPLCPSCETPLPQAGHRLANPKTLTCRSCGKPSTAAPPPRWLTKVVPEVEVLINASIDGSAPEGAGAPEVPAGTLIHFFCPNCKGNLKVDGSNRLITCEFCGASIYLPDDLWLRMHPVATVQTWYVGFGTGTSGGRKQAKLDSELLEAAYDGDSDMGIEALEKGANPNAVDDDGRTAVFFAAATGAPELVEELLGRGAEPDIPDNLGTTALNIASYNGYGDCVKVLLGHPVDIDHQNDVGTTSIYGASKMGHPEVVKMLLAEGADPDIPNEDGETPMQKAEEFGHDDVVKLLKKARR
jgi:ribosomal protein S27E